MPLYMCTFGYKPEVWAGLVKSPENRAEIVGRILDRACDLERGPHARYPTTPPSGS
jgi:hypothetical protein